MSGLPGGSTARSPGKQDCQDLARAVGALPVTQRPTFEDQVHPRGRVAFANHVGTRPDALARGDSRAKQGTIVGGGAGPIAERVVGQGGGRRRAISPGRLPKNADSVYAVPGRNEISMDRELTCVNKVNIPDGPSSCPMIPPRWQPRPYDAAGSQGTRPGRRRTRSRYWPTTTSSGRKRRWTRSSLGAPVMRLGPEDDSAK